MCRRVPNLSSGGPGTLMHRQTGPGAPLLRTLRKLRYIRTPILIGIDGSLVLVEIKRYYDLATPHLATEYYLDHLEIANELRGNIELAYYEAGHMMYVHEPSLIKYKKDLAEFIRSSH